MIAAVSVCFYKKCKSLTLGHLFSTGIYFYFDLNNPSLSLIIIP